MIPKFRAKSLANNEFVYGGFCIVHDHLGVGIPCIWEVGANGGIPIDDETLGQSTGLTDKYNFEIFEGDIVKIISQGYSYKGCVKRRNDGLWLIYPRLAYYELRGLCPNRYNQSAVEVIGNIYENKELLED